MKDTAHTRAEQHKAHLILVVIAVLISTVIILELSPFGGNVRFYAKWIECGQKPVTSDISLGFGAKVKHYVEPANIEPVRFGQPEYFCTPLESELAGYSANPHRYEFPHIESQ